MEKIIAYILLLAVVGIIIFNLNLPNKNKKHVKIEKWKRLFYTLYKGYIW